MKVLSIGLGTLGLVFSTLALGEETGEETHIPHGPHHFSVLMADTHLDGEGDNATVGLDYEYRVSSLLGLGTVLEYASGDLEATTLLAVTDVHLYEGLIMQIGPGYEHRDGENVFVARTDFLYEFEYENFTLSPQLHWDYHRRETNAFVAGIALGFSF